MEIKDIKICSKCKIEKIINEFYKTKNNRDGYQNHCKKCDNNRKTIYMRAKSKKLGKKEKQLTLIARELKEKGFKKCPGCKEIKKLESYYTSGDSNGGHSPHCIVCSNSIGNQQPKEERKQRYKRNKEKVRNTKLLNLFGISLEEYNILLKNQNGVCAICEKIDKNKSLAVDHCHNTKKIRGLLCGSCNPAIGFLKNSSELAFKLAIYLKTKGY